MHGPLKGSKNAENKTVRPIADRFLSADCFRMLIATDFTSFRFSVNFTFKIILFGNGKSFMAVKFFAVFSSSLVTEPGIADLFFSV